MRTLALLGSKKVQILSRALLVVGYFLAFYLEERPLFKVALFGCGSGYLADLGRMLKRQSILAWPAFSRGGREESRTSGGTLHGQNVGR
jgi:hypothetical protein